MYPGPKRYARAALVPLDTPLIRSDNRRAVLAARVLTLLLAGGTHTTLGALALRLGVSRHTIGRALREEHGTPFRALKAQWLASAVRSELSRADGRSIKEVAGALACHPAAFARRVKRATGESPTSLRQSLRGQGGANAVKVPRASSKR